MTSVNMQALGIVKVVVKTCSKCERILFVCVEQYRYDECILFDLQLLLFKFQGLLSRNEYFDIIRTQSRACHCIYSAF